MRLGCAVALTAMLVGCGGMVGPDKPEVASVEVTLPATMLTGDSVQATVVLRDAAGNVVDRLVTWSSSNPAIASVTSTGKVVGVSPGGPVTITATSVGKSGSASLSVLGDPRFGYASADQPATATYTPDPAYRFNSSGGAVEITRSAVGVYSVRFAGLGRGQSQHDNVQVTGYGGAAASCKTAGWQSTGGDLVAEVRCFSAAGQPADNRYTILATGAQALRGRVGFLLSPDLLASGTLDAATTYNSASGPVTLTRDGTGIYGFRFFGLGRVSGSTPEMVMVTAVGTGEERCTVFSWDRFSGVGSINCSRGSGGAINADSRFSVLWVERGRPGQRAGFAWANAAAATADYTPDTRFSLNSSGGALTAQHLGAGLYQLVFSGLGKTTGATETVLITADGPATHHCRTTSWGNTGANDLVIALSCFDFATGAPSDTRYDLIVVQ